VSYIFKVLLYCVMFSSITETTDTNHLQITPYKDKQVSHAKCFSHVSQECQRKAGGRHAPLQKRTKRRSNCGQSAIISTMTFAIHASDVKVTCVVGGACHQSGWKSSRKSHQVVARCFGYSAPGDSPSTYSRPRIHMQVFMQSVCCCC
jgi:hypothetical protein